MARRVGFVLVFVGLFLLFFGLFERFYAYPRLKKAPLDQYSSRWPPGPAPTSAAARTSSTEVTGAQLKNVRIVRGDVGAGTDEVAVWDSFNSTVDTADQGVVTATQERIALDRVTAQSVQCCARTRATRASPSSSRSTPRRPPTSSGTARPSRPCRRPSPGPRRLEGVDVYRFEQRIDRLDVGDQEIPGPVAGDPDTPSVQTDIIYSNLKTLWVEPATGIIVKAQQDVTQVLETPGGEQVLTLLDAVLTYDEGHRVQQRRRRRRRGPPLRLLGAVLPPWPGSSA